MVGHRAPLSPLPHFTHPQNPQRLTWTSPVVAPVYLTTKPKAGQWAVSISTGRPTASTWLSALGPGATATSGPSLRRAALAMQTWDWSPSLMARTLIRARAWMRTITWWLSRTFTDIASIRLNLCRERATALRGELGGDLIGSITVFEWGMNG